MTNITQKKFADDVVKKTWGTTNDITNEADPAQVMPDAIKQGFEAYSIQSGERLIPQRALASILFGSQQNIEDLQTRTTVLENKTNPATTTNQGITQLATNSETFVGTNSTSVITPLALHNTITGVKLQTIIANNQATVDITNIDIANYTNFALNITGLVANTTTVDFTLQASTTNGVSYDTGATSYAFAVTGYTTDGANINNSSAGATRILFNATTAGNRFGVQAGGSSDLYINIASLASSTLWKRFAVKTLYCSNTAGRFMTADVIGVYKGLLLPVNALRFAFSAGNIASGTFTLIGYK